MILQHRRRRQINLQILFPRFEDATDKPVYQMCYFFFNLSEIRFVKFYYSIYVIPNSAIADSVMLDSFVADSVMPNFRWYILLYQILLQQILLYKSTEKPRTAESVCDPLSLPPKRPRPLYMLRYSMPAPLARSAENKQNLMKYKVQAGLQ